MPVEVLAGGTRDGGGGAGPEAELAVPAPGEDAAVGEVRDGGDPELGWLNNDNDYALVRACV